jgi:hypothetical protein
MSWSSAIDNRNLYAKLKSYNSIQHITIAFVVVGKETPKVQYGDSSVDVQYLQ